MPPEPTAKGLDLTNHSLLMLGDLDTPEPPGATGSGVGTPDTGAAGGCVQPVRLRCLFCPFDLLKSREILLRFGRD